MQGAVSNNLLHTLLGGKVPNLVDGVAQNSDPLSNNEVDNSFQQLVIEQLNTKFAPSFIDPGSGFQQERQNTSINLNDLLGKDLPRGNRQAAISQAFLPAHAGKSVAILTYDNELADGIVGNRLTGRYQSEELLSGIINTGNAKNDPESLLVMAGENKFARNLFSQTTTNNLTANQTAISENANGNKVINQSFLELMESGSPLNKSDTLATMKQSDVSLKTLLSSLSNDGANQIDDVRPDSNSVYANVNSNAAAKPTLNMTLPLTNTPAWQQSFGEKVMWMINQNIQSADIKLNPPELGRLDIKITMLQDQTSISFTSQNQQVREMIESALPRLREMLGDSGLNLADVDVSGKSTEKDNRGLFSANDQDNVPESENEPFDKSNNTDDIIEQHILYSQDPGRIDFYA